MTLKCNESPRDTNLLKSEKKIVIQLFRFPTQTTALMFALEKSIFSPL